MIQIIYFWIALQMIFGLSSEVGPKSRLSDYNFFKGELKELNPNDRVVPYDLNTPLFSDYAWKKRFLYIPEGHEMVYDDKEVFSFPEGSILIKNFYYPADFRSPEKNISIIETRLLIKEKEGWQAYPYIWNEEQDDAFLEIAGGIKEVKWKNSKGKKVVIDYLVPNKNQCKGCHIKSKELKPIGPAARHLNRSFIFEEGEQNQLTYFQKSGILKGLPGLGNVPKNAVWDDPSTGSLTNRARAWLDINCGHCHRKEGPANTSGLFLDIYESDEFHLGINKSPVAAGKGSGNRSFDIHPGKPESSILVYRMESNDPGIRMPEIGRSVADQEGLALIKDWIRDLDD